MGDILHLPPQPEVVERYQAVKTYGTFGRMSVTLARGTMGDQGLLALCLDGLPEGVGFEILGRVPDTPEGIELADLVARAVTLALTHGCDGTDLQEPM